MTRYSGPRSPTPKKVYDVRIYRVNLTGKGLGRGGKSFFFKAPYGTYFIAAQALARAVARGQITTYGYGRATAKEIAIVRQTVTRFDVAFQRIGAELGIEWAA